MSKQPTATLTNGVFSCVVDGVEWRSTNNFDFVRETGEFAVGGVALDLRAAAYRAMGEAMHERPKDLDKSAPDPLESLAAERDDHKRYRDALEQAAICDHIGVDWDDPTKLLAHIIEFNVSVAIDPSVSEDARTLRDTYKAERDTLRTQLDRAKEAMNTAIVKIDDGSPHHARGVLDAALGEMEVEG